MTFASRELTTAPPCSTVLIHMIMSLGQILLVRSYNDRWLELDSIPVGNTGLQPLATRRKQQTRWSSHERSNAPSDCAILLLLFKGFSQQHNLCYARNKREIKQRRFERHMSTGSRLLYSWEVIMPKFQSLY